MNAPDATRAGADASRAGSARVAVIGSGALAAEIVRNLGLVGVPAATHGADEYWHSLRLADLQDCYCAVAAGLALPDRRRLNGLCQVASVDLVCAATSALGITIEVFPFGSDPDCACLECGAPVAGEAPVAPVPDPIAASIAGALAAAASLHCADQGAHRLHSPGAGEASARLPLQRRGDCAACAPPWRAPRVVRTRNRWIGRDLLAAEASSLAAQAVLLSDAIVTACECADCGPLTPLEAGVGRPVAEAAASNACPRCGRHSLRFEAGDTFRLGELAERFGDRPVPAKFALARIGGTAVCFDLEAGACERDGAAR